MMYLINLNKKKGTPTKMVSVPNFFPQIIGVNKQ